MNKQLLAISLLFLSIIGFAQTQTKIPTKQSNNPFVGNLFIGLGGDYTSFQDVKYSDVQYGGIGANLNIGYNRNKENYFWETAIELNYSIEGAKTHDNGMTTVINPIIYFKYLKPINQDFKVGARLDLIDFYLRRTQGLGNNGGYITNGHHLYGSVMHDYRLNEKWNLQSGLDLGLLSFSNESTGFAFSAPQNALENGEFNYQNESLSNPFAYKYFNWNYLGNSFSLKTSFLFQYKKRIAIGYFWDMKHFSNVKSYPVTTGRHNIIFRYNIIHK
jgi:hypothetical protein